MNYPMTDPLTRASMEEVEEMNRRIEEDYQESKKVACPCGERHFKEELQLCDGQLLCKECVKVFHEQND